MQEAQRANRPALEVLAQTSGLAGDRYARALAHAFDYRFVSSGELAQLEPDFSILPPAEATRRHCVVVHEGERLLAVFTDPFDETLRGWLELRISAPLEWALAAREELANLIARRAESLRAAGRALQDRDQRPPDRLPRLDHPEHLRRGRGAAHPRQAGAHQDERAQARCARFRMVDHRAAAAAVLASVRDAAGHRSHRQR